MSNIIKNFILVTVAVIFVTALSSCNGCSKAEEARTTWTFANHSTQTVGVFHISPNGQPDMLELAADTTADVTVVGERIDYDFGPADAVVRDRSADNNIITFYDK